MRDTATAATQAVTAGRPTAERVGLAALRVGLAFMWMAGAGWKTPPDFGEDSGTGLYRWAGYAVEYEVLAPYAWLTENLVLPNIEVFGWMVLLAEASLGAFLLVGLLTRFWALVGMAQTVAIALSVLNAPHEWPWAYYLMFLSHLVLLTTAAGRCYGLDGVLRTTWLRGGSRASRLLAVAS